MWSPTRSCFVNHYYRRVCNWPLLKVLSGWGKRIDTGIKLISGLYYFNKQDKSLRVYDKLGYICFTKSDTEFIRIQVLRLVLWNLLKLQINYFQNRILQTTVELQTTGKYYVKIESQPYGIRDKWVIWYMFMFFCTNSKFSYIKLKTLTSLSTEYFGPIKRCYCTTHVSKGVKFDPSCK